MFDEIQQENVDIKSFRLAGKDYQLSQGMIEAALASTQPKSPEKYVVVIGGTPFPPKQAISAALGIPLTTFTTMDANRILTGLGYKIIPAGGPVMPVKATSELLFEEYLAGIGVQDVQFEAERHDTTKRPDYTITTPEQQILVEVKEFRATGDDLRAGFGAYDPYRAIREKIEAGRKQFQELDTQCCCLLLYNKDKPLIDLSWQIIYGAMLGNIGFQIPFDPTTGHGNPNEMRQVFTTGGKMHAHHHGEPTRPQNTTISAIITLEHLALGQRRFRNLVARKQQQLGRELSPAEYWDLIQQNRGSTHDTGLVHLRVVVHENPYARIPLAPTLFRGPYDEHYGKDDHGYLRRLYVGSLLDQLEQEERPEWQQTEHELLRLFQRQGVGTWHDYTLPILANAVTCKNHQELVLVLRRLQSVLRAIELRKWVMRDNQWITRPFDGDPDVDAFFYNERNVDGTMNFQLRLTHHSLPYLS